MHFLRRLVAPARALSALLLLSALLAGEVADARHHLSEHGCAADSGGRDDNCTCANLHAVSLEDPTPLASAPLEHEREYAALAMSAAPRLRAPGHSSPRAPPRG